MELILKCSERYWSIIFETQSCVTSVNNSHCRDCIGKFPSRRFRFSFYWNHVCFVLHFQLHWNVQSYLWKMLTHSCVLSNINWKPNNYSFFIPCESDYENDNFKMFQFSFFVEDYLKCENFSWLNAQGLYFWARSVTL